MTISIQPVSTIEACRAIERLQAQIWQCADIEVTPNHTLLTLAKEGSIVLLALDNDKPVGFAFGFLGFTTDNCLKFASHIVGVLPAYQNSGVGYQLKLAQRELALACNINLITWTFDPNWAPCATPICPIFTGSCAINSIKVYPATVLELTGG